MTQRLLPIAADLLLREAERLARDHYSDFPYQPDADADGYQSCDGCGRAYEVAAELRRIEHLEGFADSNRDLFAEYVEGWHADTASSMSAVERDDWEGSEADDYERQADLYRAGLGYDANGYLTEIES